MCVTGNKGQSLGLGLGNHEAVKRIAMMSRERDETLVVFEACRKHLETVGN